MSDHYSTNYDTPYYHIDDYLDEVNVVLLDVEMLEADISTLDRNGSFYSEIPSDIKKVKKAYGLIENYKRKKEFKKLNETDRKFLQKHTDSLLKRIQECLKILERAGDIHHKKEVIEFLTTHQKIISKIKSKLKILKDAK